MCLRPGRLQDIVDLLLGWALEPDLPHSLRPVLLGSFAHFRAHWEAHAAFSANILTKVTRLGEGGGGGDARARCICI